MRGRKPKPTATKEAEGAYVKNPQRRNEQEPVLEVGRPIPPDCVKEDPVALAKWVEVVGWLEEMRVITKVERDLVGQYAMLYSEVERETVLVRKEGSVVIGAAGAPVRNPRAVVLANLRAQQLKLLVEMGLTPSARSRLKAAPKEEDGMLAELIKRMESLN